LSASPRQTDRNTSSNSAPPSVKVDRLAEGAFQLHVVDEDRRPPSPSDTSKVRSLMTRKPMFSSSGTRRDSATGCAVVVDLQRRLLGGFWSLWR
jgi:hypothetical protein